ncbi:hypothetical protein J6590_046090 [Homalodisca vitripennis]|nr:hypothetical protein J6590_046090 [Homalodisca vitripennis]
MNSSLRAQAFMIRCPVSCSLVAIPASSLVRECVSAINYVSRIQRLGRVNSCKLLKTGMHDYLNFSITRITCVCKLSGTVCCCKHPTAPDWEYLASKNKCQTLIGCKRSLRERSMPHFDLSESWSKPILWLDQIRSLLRSMKNSEHWVFNTLVSQIETEHIWAAFVDANKGIKKQTHDEISTFQPLHNHIDKTHDCGYRRSPLSKCKLELSQMYEQHAEELALLVANFRKKNAELRKERPACPSSLFHTWETLLQEVEVDSQAHSDIASVFGRQVSRPLLERSFHRKVQSRKVFAHRESFELVVNKAEEKLAKACRLCKVHPNDRSFEGRASERGSGSTYSVLAKKYSQLLTEHGEAVCTVEEGPYKCWGIGPNDMLLEQM